MDEDHPEAGEEEDEEIDEYDVERLLDTSQAPEVRDCLKIQKC